MKSEDEKVKSLEWAIEELSKQRDELDGKLKIARKREETGSLIDEVYAQKDALDKRISALEDGLKVSSELVDTPLGFLEEEISKVNDKLEIAKERLESLEQEQYLENLGRKLNRNLDEDFDTGSSLQVEEPDSSELLISQAASPIVDSEYSGSEKQLSTTTQTMSSPSNRIETEQPSTRLSSVAQDEKPQLTRSEEKVAIPVEGLEETAQKLGIEPDFLVAKGTQALLRMIARNGGHLTFPLELEQID